MQAMRLKQYGGPEQLELAEVPPPRPRPHEVLVEVHAAAFNPFDAKVRMGQLRTFFPLELPAVIGCDFAGVVRETGAEVRGLAPGERVFGMGMPGHFSGACAEYLTIAAPLARPVPRNLALVEAASLPMAALTAWKGLVELARVGAGQTVLVHGGAGGVGSMAVQIARAFGARVIATCSAANAELVRALGAELAIDYAAEDFSASLAGVDVVLDPIGGEVNRRSYRVMRRGGTLLVVLRADPREEASRERLQAEYGVSTRVVADIIQPASLDALRELVEAGRIRPVVERVAPLAEAPRVHAECITGQGRTGHARGKTVFRIRASSE